MLFSCTKSQKSQKTHRIFLCYFRNYKCLFMTKVLTTLFTVFYAFYHHINPTKSKWSIAEIGHSLTIYHKSCLYYHQLSDSKNQTLQKQHNSHISNTPLTHSRLCQERSECHQDKNQVCQNGIDSRGILQQKRNHRCREQSHSNDQRRRSCRHSQQ